MVLFTFLPGESKKKRRRKLHHIGFAVYEVPPHMARLTPVYVAEHVRDRLVMDFYRIWPKLIE